MFFFPTLFFIFISLILQGNTVKIVAIVLAIITLVDNVYNGWWAADLYSLSFAILVFLQNPAFFKQWNTVVNQAKSEKKLKATPEQIKHARIAIFIIACSFMFPVIGFYSMSYPDYTNLLILGSGVLAFILGTTYLLIINQGKEPAVKSNLKTDTSLGWTAFALIMIWPLAYIAFEVTNNNFVIPALFIIVLGLLSFFFVYGKASYLAAGTIIIVSDFCWRFYNYLMFAKIINPTILITQLIAMAVFLIGIFWLLRKPSYLTLSLLTLLITGRYVNVIYQIYMHLVPNLASVQLVKIIVFQTCWMLLAPIMLFWFGAGKTGVRHR